jgi:hypothetical protein
VSTVSPDCLTPHLDSITTVMLMGLKSTEGVTVAPHLFKAPYEMNGLLITGEILVSHTFYSLF